MPQALFRIVERGAPTAASILIHGETGSGKELVARAVHHASPRADRPFVSINCAALPEGLLESELFGHEKGSFSGAVARSLGLFRAAHGGTLFLDDVLPARIRGWSPNDADAGDGAMAPAVTLADVERRHVLRALASAGGDRKTAADVLGIDLSTLYRKLKRWEDDA